MMQEKLIILMKERNVTNKKLADIIGVSEKQLGYKIKGKSDFKSSEMFKIADYFKVNIDDIFLPSMYENGTNSNDLVTELEDFIAEGDKKWYPNI